MRFLIISVSLLLFSGLMAQESYQSVELKGIKFSWKVSGDYLDVILSAPTNGWVSVGFDPSKKMKDANYILASVVNGNVLARDDFGTSNIGHKSDEDLGGVNNITNLTGYEKEKFTEVSFSIPLDSGDKFDTKLFKGKHTILLAYSLADDFKKLHKVHAKTEIEIK